MAEKRQFQSTLCVKKGFFFVEKSDKIGQNRISREKRWVSVK